MKRIEKGRFADIWARKTMTEGELSLFFTVHHHSATHGHSRVSES
jgi:hypothetical protein